MSDSKCDEFLKCDVIPNADTKMADDNFSLYLCDIREESVMDEDQLKRIYQRIEEKPEQKRELINQVVEANLKLVLFFAKRYTNRGLEFQDLIQFGNIGLVVAAWKYDYRKGTKFSTLASSWIVHEIERSISLYARPVRLPENVLLEQMQITKTEIALRKEYGREPKNEETANRLGISLKRLCRMKMLKKKAISLDAHLINEDNTTLGDLLPGTANVADQVIKGINADIIREILESLPEKEQYILKCRYGENSSTLKEIGEEFNITKEAVRRREISAKAKLRKLLEDRDLTIDDLIT